MELKELLGGRNVFLFDFDGVVTDSETYAFETLRALVRDHFGKHIADEDITITIGMDVYGSSREISRKYGIDLSAERMIELLRGYPDYYTEYEGIKAFPHLPELFRTISERGGRIAIVSSTGYEHLCRALERMALSEFPEIIVSGDRVGRRKPDPEPYLRALEILGAAKEESIVIEDSPVGILAAKRAGLPVIAYCGSSVVQDVSGADTSIRDYSQILQLL